jgi:hypothetical protein
LKYYGTGEKTDMEQTILESITTGWKKEDLEIPKKDRGILRELAYKVKDISSNNRQKEKIQLWKDHNMLKKTRPVIFCDPENGWNEIITENLMKCTSNIGRAWEMRLRKEIFWGEEMGDDRPVVDYFDVPYTTEPDNWNLAAEIHRGTNRDNTFQGGSYKWDPPIKNYDRDLKNIKYINPEIDYEVTEGTDLLAEEIFGDILKVRLKGTWWWSLGITLPTVFLRGLENLLLDFCLHPSELKELLSIVSKGLMRKLDFLEKNNLLSLNNDNTYIGSGGIGHTKELPQKDFDSLHVKLIDMWGFAESQETVNVSPEMYEEFIFPNEKPLLDRFGLNCYGCCEPVNSRWHVIKRHSRMRRISCSAWVDVDKMASELKENYIFSRKPNPAVLAVENINVAAIRKDLRDFFERTKDCIVEVIMKDNHTIGNNPKNVIEWCRIAKEEAIKI